MYTYCQSHQVVYTNYIQIFVCRKKERLLLADYFRIIPALVGNIWIKFSKLPQHCITGLYIGGAYFGLSENEARKQCITSFPSHCSMSRTAIIITGIVVRFYFRVRWTFLVSQVFCLVFSSEISNSPNIEEKHQGSRLNISMLEWCWIIFAWCLKQISMSWNNIQNMFIKTKLCLLPPCLSQCVAISHVQMCTGVLVIQTVEI